MTNLKNTVESLDSRWRELAIYLEHFRQIEEDDTTDVYQLLGSVSVILVCSHFEGAIKDVCISIVKDLNSKLQFCNFPRALKREYVKKYFIKQEIGDDKLVEKLIEQLEKLEMKIDEERLFHDSSNMNMKNLGRYAKLFGVDKLGEELSKFSSDEIFQGDIVYYNDREDNLITRLRTKCLIASEVYPYNSVEHDATVSASGSDMFNDFLNDLLMKRNNSAHGKSNEYVITHTELGRMIGKIEVLTYGFILAITQELSFDAVV